MLKQRVLTALILIPLVLAAFHYLPTDILAILIGLIILLGAWEWGEISGLTSPQQLVFFVLFNACAMLLCFTQLNSEFFIRGILLFAILGWVFALLTVLHIQKTQLTLKQNTIISLLIGTMIVIPAWFSILLIHSADGVRGSWVIFLMVMIWAADSGAYFAGRQFGKHKLADKISPGKSWEGVIGALIASLIVAYIGGRFQGLDGTLLYLFLLLSLGVVSISIVGDLIESLFKRIAGVKDSSNLLPGHGGIMDRIDSLTSAAPFFAASLLILGVGQS